MNKKEIRHRLENIAKELQVLFNVIDADEPVFPPESAKLVEARICLECKKPIEPNRRPIRGLHESCRKTLGRRLKELGKSEDFAISQGWLLPEESGGRPPKKTASLQHLEQIVKQQERKNAAKSRKTSTKKDQRET